MTPTPRPPWRELRQRTQPRRGLLLYEAALYVGLDARRFGRAVVRQQAPQPRVMLGASRWDIADLDRWIEEQPHRGERPSEHLRRYKRIPARI